MKFPEGVNSGRGARAEYGATQIFQLAVMLALLDAGLHPERAKDAILATWSTIRTGLGAAAVSSAHRTFNTVYCFLQINGLEKLRYPEASNGFVAHLRTRNQLADAIRKPGHVPESHQAAWVARTLYAMSPTTSSIILDLDFLLHGILASMKLTNIDLSICATDLNKWASTYETDELHIASPEQLTIENIGSQEWIGKYVNNAAAQVDEFDDLCRQALRMKRLTDGDS